MAVLRFTKQWIEPILSGRKTQTLRKKVSSTVIVAETVEAWNGYSRDRMFAVLVILAVDTVAVSELSELDAHRDGFESLPELRRALRGLYPGTRSLYRIRFRVARNV